jgi:hypothetical protein
MARRVMGVVATILVIVVALVAFERSFSPSFKSCIAQQSEQNRSDTSKENPSGLFASATRYVECTGDFIDKNNGAITSIATIVIAAFTATLWRATTRQSDLTREALIADKRPFAFPDAINSYWEDSTSHPGHYDWRFRPVWQNSGDTAPKNLAIQSNCELRNTPLPMDYPFTSNVATGGGILGPKMRAPAGLAPAMPNPAISPQDIVDVEQGRKFLYLWGWAKYEDGFPQTPIHLTHFCWQIFPKGKPFEFVPGKIPPAEGSLGFDHIQIAQGNFTKDE